MRQVRLDPSLVKKLERFPMTSFQNGYYVPPAYFRQ
jgi:hypothetical protein